MNTDKYEQEIHKLFRTTVQHDIPRRLRMLADNLNDDLRIERNRERQLAQQLADRPTFPERDCGYQVPHSPHVWSVDLTVTDTSFKNKTFFCVGR